MKPLYRILLGALLLVSLVSSLTVAPAFAAVYDDPASYGAAVTPHDTNALSTPSRGIYVGVAGDLTVITIGGSTVTFVGVTAGSLIPVRASHVKSTGTTATSIVSLW